MNQRKAMIDKNHPKISVRRQCQLLAVNRNRLEPKARKQSAANLELCRIIDALHMENPAFGARKLSAVLQTHHHIKAGRDRVRRLMRVMGIEAVYPRPRTSVAASGSQHRVYPYLLRERQVQGADEVWCADITYVPRARGHGYLVAIMDWHSRAVLSWRLSNTADTSLCLEAFEEALQVAGRAPQIFNTDQGCQFTARAWCERLERCGVRVSMDGRGRWLDNVFIERLWRTVKYEKIYLMEHASLHELEAGLDSWFERYNCWRPHDSLGKATPWSVYRPTTQSQAA